MDTLIKAWKKLRGSPYSGDLAIGLLVFGALRLAGQEGFLEMEPSVSIPIALGVGLLSAAVDLIPAGDE